MCLYKDIIIDIINVYWKLFQVNNSNYKNKIVWVLSEII